MHADLRDLSERTLGKVLLQQSRNIPDKTFLMFGDQHYTFSEVNARVNRYANGLSALGLQHGDRIAIYLNSCVEFIVVTLAANKLGVIWIPINIDYKGEWLLSSITDSRIKVLVSESRLLPNFNGMEERLDFAHLLLRDETVLGHNFSAQVDSLSDFERLEDKEPDQSAVALSDTACIMWTSGTTGKSKGVMQCHNVWIQSAEVSIEVMGVTDTDIIYNCLPLYNSAAWVSSVYRALVAGISCGIDTAFSAKQFWQRISFYRATMTMTLGAMHMFLWNAEATEQDADNTLRCASMIPMPEDIIAPFCKRFGLQAVYQGFGQSECMSLMLRDNRAGQQWKSGSLGRVVGPVAVEILDENDNPVAVGDVGELCLRPLKPYTLFSGYFDNGEATLATLRNLWYHSGDLVRRDKDNEYFFVDRKKDYIRYKGRSVASAQIESVVRKHPAVAEVAAIGVPSEELESESEIKIVVVLKPDVQLEPEVLAQFINDNAPYYVVPRFIDFVEALPYTPTKKVQKYLLRERGNCENTWDRIASGFTLKR